MDGDHEADAGLGTGDWPAVTGIGGYWDRVRAGRSMPLRAEIEPRGIEAHLEYAFILERLAPGVSRFRLAGSHLADLVGSEVRGMPPTALFDPGSRRAVADEIERVFMGPARVEFRLSAETQFGRPPLAGRMLVLPLRSDLGDVSRALGALVMKGEIGRAPRRFVVKDVRAYPLGPAAPRVRAEAAGMAEAAAEFVPLVPGERPYLRLIRTEG